ncbi:MAG TPA: guanylate kinase [Fimbriimonadaceae bacterium]|nr:guanylate kinase [Fimbriimonadaceae bacterium]
MSGHLVILSGPSGVGKDTVLDAWAKQNPRVQRVVAYTTRPKRATEVEGVDYKFVSVNQFRELIAGGAFLEFKEVFGNLYGTPLLETEEMLAAGKVAVLKIDVQGALTVMKLREDAVTVFLMPPSFEELERRIRERATDAAEVIERRLRTARDEIALAPEYRHVIVNRKVEEVVETLDALVS